MQNLVGELFLRINRLALVRFPHRRRAHLTPALKHPDPLLNRELKPPHLEWIIPPIILARPANALIDENSESLVLAEIVVQGSLGRCINGGRVRGTSWVFNLFGEL